MNNYKCIQIKFSIFLILFVYFIIIRLKNERTAPFSSISHF
jgi:hypothetical protein